MNRTFRLISFIVIFSIVIVSCDNREKFSFSDAIAFSIEPLTGDSLTVEPSSFFHFYDRDGNEVLSACHSVEDMFVDSDTAAATRAILVTTEDGLSSGFGVYAYSKNKSSYIIDGKVATKQSDGKWKTVSSPNWEAGDELTVIAYYPSNLNPNKSTGSFSYTINSNSTVQKDAMLAYYKGSSDTGIASLSFSHALTAVRFIWGDVQKAVKIKSIALDGVYYSGQCTPTLSEMTYSWTPGSTFTYEQGDLTMDVPAEGTLLTADQYTFLCIPQNLAEQSVTIYLTINDGTKDFTVSKELNTGSWEPGKVNIYNLGYKDQYEYIIDDIPDVVVSYEGGTPSFSVKSYKKNKSTAELSAQPWKVQYKDGDKWIDGYPSGSLITGMTKISGTGSTSTPETVGVTISAQTMTPKTVPASEHRQILLRNPEKHNFDLSFYDPSLNYTVPESAQTESLRRSANCYVINASGTYNFPAVYGNSLNNPSAYIPTAAQSLDDATAKANYLLKRFVDNNDNPIEHPYIIDQLGGTSSNYSVVLAWEDVDYLIDEESLTLSEDGKRISFSVPRETIAPGNAVIALKKGSTVVWSWHIWVTDELLYKIQTLTDEYKLMPTNIGWVYSGEAYAKVFEGRDKQMRVTSGTAEKLFRVIQMDYVYDIQSAKGNGPFFQWGRKDPMAAGDGITVGNSVKYSSKCGQKNLHPNFTITSACTIGQSISQPNQMKPGLCPTDVWATLTKQGDWCQDHYVNRWNGNILSDQDYKLNDEHGSLVEKTIYDPSPIGFKVPNLGVFKVLSSYKSHLSWDSSKHVEYTSTLIKGQYFWMPCTGFRAVYYYPDGNLYWFGEISGFGKSYYDNIYEILYSTASPKGYTAMVFQVGINSSGSYTSGSPGYSNFWISIATPIRPMKE